MMKDWYMGKLQKKISKSSNIFKVFFHSLYSFLFSSHVSLHQNTCGFVWDKNMKLSKSVDTEKRMMFDIVLDVTNV